jgi:hypothetical protein
VWQISVDDFLGSRPAVDIGVEMNRGSCSPWSGERDHPEIVIRWGKRLHVHKARGSGPSSLLFLILSRTYGSAIPPPSPDTYTHQPHWFSLGEGVRCVWDPGPQAMWDGQRERQQATDTNTNTHHLSSTAKAYLRVPEVAVVWASCHCLLCYWDFLHKKNVDIYYLYR